MADTGGFTLMTRPKTPEEPDPQDTGGFQVVSRPKPTQRVGLAGNYARTVDEAIANMREGATRAVAPGASAWERTKGVGQAALGGVGYVGSPIEALTRTYVADPIQNTANSAGAPEWLAQMLGNTADIGAQVFGGGGAKKLIEAAPGVVRAIPGAINEGANAIGGLMRSGVNTVDDVIRNQVTQAGRRAADRAANAAPTREALEGQSTAAFQDASRIGAQVRPEAFATFADNVPTVLRANRVISGDIPMSRRIYEETGHLVDRLEDYRGHPLTLENLQSLQQEAQGFVKNALIKAEGDRGAQDVRGAQILSRQIRDFIDNLNPEQVSSGNPQEAVAALNRAKELWRRNEKMNTIENILDISERIGDPKYIQNEFKRIAADDLEFRRFSPAEQRLITDIASPNRAIEVGKAAPVIGGMVRTVEKGAKALGANPYASRARELLDTIARGEAAQTDAAATAANTPSFGQRLNDILRPQPPNSANRRLP